jgi:anti-anti-sigma factor
MLNPALSALLTAGKSKSGECMPTPAWIEIESLDDGLIARFTEPLRLTGEKAEEVGRCLATLLDDAKGDRVVINLRNIDVVTSLIIGKLFGLQRQAVAAGKRLVLCEVNPVIREIFQITRLTEFVDLFETEIEARQSR